MLYSYDSDLVKKFGLETAIVISLLQSQQTTAITKNKLFKDKYFKLNQSTIRDASGLVKSDQDDILKSLQRCGMLHRSRDDTTYVYIDDPLLDYNFVLKTKVSAKEAEKLAKLNYLKSCVKTQNTELFEAYCEWIEAVYDKQGWLAPKAVELAETVVDEFANHDLDVALAVICIGTISGYRDMSWAVNAYKSKEPTAQRKVQTTVTTRSTQLTKETF